MDANNAPVVLSREEWKIAEALARELAPNVDRNELGKVLAYFHRVRNKDKFFKLLERLPRSGYVRSNQTRDYLNRIADACQKHLRSVKDDRHALAVLGWSFRLMTHYQTQSGQRSASDRPRPRRR
jgi:hypothetical protein